MKPGPGADVKGQGEAEAPQGHMWPLEIHCSYGHGASLQGYPLSRQDD